jgi:hypothetical protein
MVGKSYGGTMTTYTAALDDRIKAACVSGYLSTLDDAMSRRGLGNYCGAQYLPGLLEWGDIPDVVGLIAPRPLLIEAGERDTCFVFPDTTKAYERLAKIRGSWTSGAPRPGRRRCRARVHLRKTAWLLREILGDMSTFFYHVHIVPPQTYVLHVIP